MPCRARVRQWKIVSNEIVPFAGRAGGVPRRERVTAAARTLIKECIKIVPWRCAKMEQSGLGIYTGICHTKKTGVVFAHDSLQHRVNGAHGQDHEKLRAQSAMSSHGDSEMVPEMWKGGGGGTQVIWGSAAP